jgi:stage II sporulation protein R
VINGLILKAAHLLYPSQNISKHTNYPLLFTLMKHLLAAFALLITVAYCATVETEQTELSSKLIRLHVVANSDSASDQSYKLEVRDRLLAEIAPLLNGAETQREAEERLNAALPALALKFPDTELSIADEQFPERQYDTFSLPAGEYTALRAVIGDGGGKNWWCVLFPPLCVEAVTAPADDYGSSDSTDAFALLSDDEVDLITSSDDGYILKFRILDLIARLRK